MRRGAWLVLVLGCSRGADPSTQRAPGADTTAAVGTPVQVAAVARATLPVTVSGPGRTEALRQLRVRAPFVGTLLSLTVADGDRVERGEAIGAVVSRNSEAALAGARAMLDDARTPQEQADARRALELARQGLVQSPLRAPEAGVVLGHAANQGDLVNEGDEIVTIAAAGSIVFVADITQDALPRIHRGQPATVALAAQPAPARGTVHAVLPSASSDRLTAPVRIDLAAELRPVAVGLFGTARIVVGEARDVLVVPAAAVLRDDISGSSRVALVTGEGRVRWVAVTPGVGAAGLVQIESPLALGDRVITGGQVGLPDGAPVRVVP